MGQPQHKSSKVCQKCQNTIQGSHPLYIFRVLFQQPIKAMHARGRATDWKITCGDFFLHVHYSTLVDGPTNPK